VLPNPSWHTLLPCTSLHVEPSRTRRPPGPRTMGVGAAEATEMSEIKAMEKNFIVKVVVRPAHKCRNALLKGCAPRRMKMGTVIYGCE
jgi:hypothetical protein